MDVMLVGTAGPLGWPAHGCGCASCRRLRASGEARAPTSFIVDDAFRLGVEQPPSGYRVRPLPGTPPGPPAAYDLTGPDGDRVLAATAPGALPPSVLAATDPARPYELVLLDLVEAPQQLGELRRRGAVTATTEVISVHVDHRVSSPAELGRRLGFWGAGLVADGTTVSTTATPAARPGAPRRVLLLGGARSGKSEEAELRLAGEPAVTYVATGIDRADDPEWQAKIAAHRYRRPPGWRTIETTDLPLALHAADSPLLIDGLGGWLAAVLDECGAGYGGAADRVRTRTDELVFAWRETEAYVVAVSDEVGGGVVPETPSGRRFRDELGLLNQRIAEQSDEVALVVAGRVLSMPG